MHAPPTTQSPSPFRKKKKNRAGRVGTLDSWFDQPLVAMQLIAMQTAAWQQHRFYLFFFCWCYGFVPCRGGMSKSEWDRQTSCEKKMLTVQIVKCSATMVDQSCVNHTRRLPNCVFGPDTDHNLRGATTVYVYTMWGVMGRKQMDKIRWVRFESMILLILFSREAYAIMSPYSI